MGTLEVLIMGAHAGNWEQAGPYMNVHVFDKFGVGALG